MPANETTWRDTLQLHRIFAVTGVLLTIGTVWMFWKDHDRSWKTYQVNANNVDLKMNELRQLQYKTGDALLTHQQRARELAIAKARPIDEALLGQFKSEATTLNEVLNRWKKSGHAYSEVAFDEAGVDRDAAKLKALSQESQDKRAKADAAEKEVDKALAEAQAKPNDTTAQEPLAKRDEEARQANQAATGAEEKAASARAALVQELFRVVDTARMQWEEKALGIRKFKNGKIDAAKANVDIAIRDSLPAEERQAREAIVNELVGDMVHPDRDAEAGKDTLAALNEIYQTISKARKDLEKTYKLIIADVETAQKAYDESVAELARLRSQERDREEKFLFTNRYPLLFGKGILTLPILDAFNSPRRIENLWSEGLTQNYNFSYVRRFDRCTTCHQSLVKTLPGTSTSPAFIQEESLEMVVIPPAKDAAPKPKRDADGKALPPTLEDWLGLRLASEGLLERDDVTVALVVPKTPAAKAQILANRPVGPQVGGRELRQAAAQLVSQPGEGENLYPTLPGLMVGDVIEGIAQGNEPMEPLATSGGDRGPRRIAARLRDLAEEGKPIRLAVRRGLPNPYISHPRLDLFVSDGSPHRMQTFACTICHDGQGSATAFEWASHSPSSTLDMERWQKEHGWFDNPHWIFPMYAKRFTQAACLKCHHDVTELESSEKYADAPAPKVTHGYHLVRKYGCYGCHEVNGFDGPTRRVGPDLRSEPNYFAVAQQVEAELVAAGRGGEPTPDQQVSKERLDFWKGQLSGLTSRVTTSPDDAEARLLLKSTIDEGVASLGADTTRLDKTLLTLSNMLKDVETPGALRRPGPSLRYIAKKSDATFLYDWIANPQHFRPTTRMPRFFGLWDHLKDSHGHMTDEKAPKLEPIEIRGVLAYFDSYKNDQPFEPEPRPTGIDRWTSEEKLARGKTQFQTRGCLACHTHSDFPDVQKFRSPDEIVQGPDLSGVGSKFAKDRNPNGPDWLYSWIKNPTRYHARTVMPNLFLDPEKDGGANPADASDDKWFDPADDIVSYLLSSKVDWQPIAAAAAASQPLTEDDPQLKQLMLEYLNEAFYKDVADDYYTLGIPPHLEGELKGAEKDLIVHGGADRRLTNEQRLKYIGRKTIAKYGCFGCHDIPGFEDAKPIGTGLADWGRKDPSRLAFEHIAHYIEHGHGHAAHSDAAHQSTQPVGPESKGGVIKAEDGRAKTSSEALYADSKAKSKQAVPDASATAPTSESEHPHPGPLPEGEGEEFKSFYTHALEAGNRIGFIYQKLKEPRSYDFDKTENKKFNERLRMPQFGFTAKEREAVITFVLGLVADPPQPKYIFQAKDRNAALIAGRQVLEKYNCGGCHILGLEKWQLSHAPGEFGEREEPAIYPFLKPHFSPKELAAAAKPDKRNELHATIHGLPQMEKDDGLPVMIDLDGSKLDNDSPYGEREVKFNLELYQPAIVDGSGYLTGQAPIFASRQQIDSRHPSWGGVLTKYLMPVVTGLERKSNPNASGSEAYGWLPPPLINEGNKVQTSWLHDFLLNPYPIRPAAFMRMPKFNMSSAEATALANYFAAVDHADFPYAYSSGRDRTRLSELEAAYQKNSQGTGDRGRGTGGAASASAETSQAPPDMQRLHDAMKIVVNGNFCVKCHLVGDFSPTGSIRAKAPQLADVYRRLRPDYLRDWIANPKLILPYTPMPTNIEYKNPQPILSQLYHGTNVEQIQAITDLLMNYDQYARQSTRIADRVVPAPAEGAAPGATAPATGGNGGSN